MANEFIVRKGLINLGGETVAVTDIVSGYTVTSDDYYIRCSGSTGFDVTLPEITGGGKTYIIKNVTDTTVNVLSDASNTIDGESTYSLGLNDTLQLIAQDTEWNVIGSASVDISVSANTGLGITENNSLYTIYNSVLSPDLAMTSSVGGISAGTTVSDLTGFTLVRIFDNILFPVAYPTYTVPSISIKVSGNADGTFEVGTSKSVSYYAEATKNDAGNFTSLRIRRNGGDVLTDNSPTTATTTNLPAQFGFADPNNPNYKFTSGTFSESFTIAAPTGTSTRSTRYYDVEGDYNAGLPKYDNKGNLDTRVAEVRQTDAPQDGDTNFDSSNETFYGVYPYWYGTATTQPTIVTIQDAISGGTANKPLVPTDNQDNTLTITFGADGAFLWFAHYTEYDEKKSYYVSEFNKGNFSESDLFNTFVEGNITSPDGLWSDVPYKIYIGNYQTTTTSFGSMQLQKTIITT